MIQKLFKFYETKVEKFFFLFSLAFERNFFQKRKLNLICRTKKSQTSHFLLEERYVIKRQLTKNCQSHLVGKSPEGFHLGDWQTMEKIRAISRVAPIMGSSGRRGWFQLSSWLYSLLFGARSCALSELHASSRPEAVEAHGHTDLYNSWKKLIFIIFIRKYRSWSSYWKSDQTLEKVSLKKVFLSQLVQKLLSFISPTLTLG